MTPEQFKEARHKLGLNQTQMALILGYTAPPRISEIENGKKNPNASVILLLKAYLAGYRPDNWPA